MASSTRLLITPEPASQQETKYEPHFAKIEAENALRVPSLCLVPGLSLFPPGILPIINEYALSTPYVDQTPDYNEETDQKLSSSETKLDLPVIAAKSGCFKTIQKLLDKGFTGELLYTDKHLQHFHSLFIIACRHRQWGVCFLLLDLCRNDFAGGLVFPDFTSLNFGGQTSLWETPYDLIIRSPLEEAVSQGYEPIVRALLQRGALPTLENFTDSKQLDPGIVKIVQDKAGPGVDIFTPAVEEPQDHVEAKNYARDIYAHRK